MGIFDFMKRKKKQTLKKSYSTFQLMPQVGFLPKWSDFNATRAIREGYKRSTWVYACVKLRAANIAQVPWVVETLKGGEWEAVEEHPLADLIRNPNPDFDWSDMIRRAVYWLDLSGDAYWTIIRNGAGRVSEVWPLIPDSMDIVPGRERLVEAYKYRKDSVSKLMPAEEVLHIKYANPGDVYYGLSPLNAAGRAVDIDEAAEKWQKVSLQNMAVPAGIYVGPDDMTQEQYNELTENIREQSGPDNAGKPWVTAGAKWQPMGNTAKELDFVESRKLTREEICSAFSVPPPLVGIYDKATLSNIETARQILWNEGLIPALEEIEGQLNRQLAREYPGTRLRYDLSNVDALSENLESKVRKAKELWSMGVPLEQINQRLELGLELEGLPGADKGYISSSLTPTDMDSLPDLDPELVRRIYGESTD
jgi:HK97 family phage portal protein